MPKPIDPHDRQVTPRPELEKRTRRQLDPEELRGVMIGGVEDA